MLCVPAKRGSMLQILILFLLVVSAQARIYRSESTYAPDGQRQARLGRLTTADEEEVWQSAPLHPNDRLEDLTSDETVLREIPDFVLDYAPLVHLYSGEQYWPGDIAEHLEHTTPTLNYTPIEGASSHPTLKNLDQYNEYHNGRWIYLNSNDDPEARPLADWLGGEKNIPKIPEELVDDFDGNEGWIYHKGRHCASVSQDGICSMTEGSSRSTKHENISEHRRGGRSDAPAVLIVINKGDGIVDAFWFYFYSFNQGNSVFRIRFGNHVGDWEHSAIRFHHGKPKAVYYSEHSFGAAYSYEAVEKYGKRPIVYSATGTHANYATEGAHPYILPLGILHDQTDKGPLWDPVLNNHAFTYDHAANIIRASNLTPESPTEWFHFGGHWGDRIYPFADKRQYQFGGQYHYVSGPLGPKFKNLGRRRICGGPDSQKCVIRHWLGERSVPIEQLPDEEVDLPGEKWVS